MTIGVTTAEEQILGFPPHPPIRVTQEFLAMVGGPGNPLRQTTRVTFAVFGTQPTPIQHHTTLNYAILATRSPNYELTDVIFPDVFPFDISYNSVGSVRFATDVTLVDSGNDQRTQRWNQPLMEYDVAYGVRTMEQLLALISFFRSMRGRLNAFNYRDNVDYTSSIPIAIEARAAPPIRPTDQLQMVGDSSTYTFQLIKTYTTPSGETNFVRTITRPEPASVFSPGYAGVTVALNGVPAPWANVNYDNGTVTFSSPYSDTITAAISKTVLSNALGATYSGPAGTFNGFKPYVGSRVVVTGWANPVNNVAVTQTGVIINGVAADGSSMGVTYPAGGLLAEANVANVSISIHPAPATGVAVTAGFQFFVPVRFDTDTLPVTIEDYGIGGSNSIKLVEVRSYSF